MTSDITRELNRDQECEHFLSLIVFMFLMFMIYLQSDESVYEQECGNKPGFAVYYRFPNSQRVTFNQFIRVSSFFYSVVDRVFYLSSCMPICGSCCIDRRIEIENQNMTASQRILQV